MKPKVAVVMIVLCVSLVAFGRSFEQDANAVDLEGTVIYNADLDAGLRLLKIANAPTPSTDVRVSAVCPFQPGSPDLTDTYDACAAIPVGSRVRIAGVLHGQLDNSGFTRLYVKEISIQP